MDHSRARASTSRHAEGGRLGRVVLAALILPIAGALSFIGAVVSSAPAQASTVPPAPSGWSTVWSDSFSGAAGSQPSTSNWIYDQGNNNGWGNGEVESYTSNTANVSEDGNGHLDITPINSGGQWTSARLETQRDDFEAPAGGEMEVTASLEQPNPADGSGYWPAFWMLGSGLRNGGTWPSTGEVDMMEDVNALSEAAQTFHCGTDPGGPCNEPTGIGTGLQACSGCQTGYHTYSAIIDRTDTSAEQLRFYIDGNLNYTINESQVGTTTWQNAIDNGFFILLNVAIGGSFPNGVCGCTTPSASTSSGAAMSVGYVAVYETSSGSGTTTTTTAATTTTTAATTTTTVASGSGYNNTGVSADGSGGSANFDGDGYSYSANALSAAGVNPGTQFSADGFTFTWPDVGAGSPDNYQATGQSIPVSLPGGSTEMGVLGSATDAGTTGSSGTVTINYSDGSSSTQTLQFPDWCLGGGGGTVPSGSSEAVTMSYRNDASGTQTINTYVFATSVPVDSSKTVVSVTLPSSVSTGQLHVFAFSGNGSGTTTTTAPATTTTTAATTTTTAATTTTTTSAGGHRGRPKTPASSPAA